MVQKKRKKKESRKSESKLHTVSVEEKVAQVRPWRGVTQTHTHIHTQMNVSVFMTV